MRLLALCDRWADSRDAETEIVNTSGTQARVYCAVPIGHAWEPLWNTVEIDIPPGAARTVLVMPRPIRLPDPSYLASSILLRCRTYESATAVGPHRLTILQVGALQQ